MTQRQKTIWLWIIAAILGLLIGVFFADDSEAQTTRETCWRNGATIQCREQTWGAPSRGSTTTQKRCWRNGAQLVCETTR